MDPGHMISFRRFGYRMIGQTSLDRMEVTRARYLGDPAPLLNLGPSTAPAGTFAGETFTAAPRATPHTLTLHLGPPPAAPARHPLALHLGPQVTVSAPAPAAPPPSDGDVLPPTIVATPDCPPCPTCTSPALAAGAGALGGALLMYVVGLATRETKRRR